MKITLINHACCKVSAGSLTILCDPWTEGAAFNNGWDLLIPTPLSFDQVMEGVTHIWLSHEHPDHFSVPFLSKVAKAYSESVVILFQKTRDHRVFNFCTSLGLTVRELEDKVPTRLTPEVSVTCGVADFYDSWLYVTDGKNSVLNLNDVHTRADSEIRQIAKLAPSPTVLMAQFSYASWKGGRDNTAYRSTAAAQKLETLSRQVRGLKPKFAIPFASLVYFSNEENNYLNDCINTPAKATAAIAQTNTSPVLLYPGDTWDSSSGAHDNSLALARFEEQYKALNKLPLRPAGQSASLEEIRTEFRKYQTRIFAKNSRTMILLLTRIALMQAFQPVIIRLSDTNVTLSVSIIDGLTEMDSATVYDVSMHSSSLLFIFKNEFGFDTLMVNGRFESSTAGFSKMTKAFAVGSLNAMGLSLSPALLVDVRFIVILLRILNGVMNKLRSSEKATVAATASETKSVAPDRELTGTRK
jgi:UDP-MurNAc hydroxylase